MGGFQMERNPVTLYIACSLTQAPKDFKQKIARLKELLRGQGYSVLDFNSLEEDTPADAYRMDLQYTRECDLLVAVCDHPAIGLGMETMKRIMQGTPLLLAAHADAGISRMLTGAAEVEPSVRLVRFSSMEELSEIIRRHIAVLKLGQQGALELDTVVA